jgi:hypothetical protein
MSIVLQSSGGGQVTIQEPATASNFTQTLPASTGTILTTGSPQSGSVIQVVNAKFEEQASSTSTTYADTGLAATITPRFATSTILVLVNHSGVSKTGDTRAKIRLLRNASSIATLDFNGGYTQNTGIIRIGSISTSYLDNPATTSATTYKTQFGLFDGSGTVLMQADACTATITLMEIAV